MSVFLRPIGDKKGKFKLIGDCYVQGVMDGEAVPEGEEMENFQIV